LREARLIAAGPYALVDPNRSGSISASACHGDSGGPVLHGSVLVGVISRAAHPHPRIACGHLTRWAPIVISATPAETTGRAAASPDGGVHLPRRHTARPRSATLTSTQRVANKPARAPLE
jgi:hypothetical protein